jgi:heat shock protein HspQ
MTTDSSASAVGQKLVHGSSDLGDRVKWRVRRPVGVVIDCDPELFFKGKDV